MIKVKNLTKYFSSQRAIHDLTFSAKKGEILGLLGPNGAGKTTTMRILAGFMPPSNGNVEVGGFDCIEDSLKVRRIIGYLPENAPLYLEMKVFNYLAYMVSLRGLRNYEQRIDKILELVGLSDRAEDVIGTLSKGLRQRLGLAQALIHDPPILILDEPTIGLDPVQIKEVRDLIIKIRSKKTIILSTHILSEAQQLCDRVLIINKGEIVAEDTPQNLSSRLAGNLQITIKFHGDINNAVKKLTVLPGVISLLQKNEEEMSIEINPNNDISPKIARLLVQSGIDLYQLTPSKPSLEDVFLALTRDEIPSPEIDGSIIS